MRGLKLVVFVLSFMVLSAQLLRHTHERWITKRQSALDQYASNTKAAVLEATSIEELVRRYAVELERSKHAAAERARVADPGAARQYAVPPESDPLVFELGAAIRDWESKENEIRALAFFWTCACALWVLAVVCNRRGWDWIALAIQTLAFSEMIYWTSPSLMPGTPHELIRLLNYKLLFAGLSLMLLLISWQLRLLRPNPTT